MEPELSPEEKKTLDLLEMALNGGNDADLALSDRVDSIEEKIDTVQKQEGPQGIQGEKGEQGEQGVPGVDGKDGERGEKGDKGEKGDTGATGLPGKDGVDGKDGAQGTNGKDGVDGKDGSPDTPDEVVDKVNLATKQIRADKIEGLADLERNVRSSNFDVRIGISKTEFNTRVGALENVQLGKPLSITYNTNGTLNYVETPRGRKTFTYSGVAITGMVGTGGYASKSFTYDSQGRLTNVT